jgi:hypothetical protein
LASGISMVRAKLECWASLVLGMSPGETATTVQFGRLRRQ